MKHTAFAKWFFLLAFAAIVYFAAPESMAGDELKKASFIPQWSPQAQFAGEKAPKFSSFYRGRQADAQ